MRAKLVRKTFLVDHTQSHTVLGRVDVVHQGSRFWEAVDRELVGKGGSASGQARLQGQVTEQRTERNARTSAGDRRDQKEMPCHRSRPSGHANLSRQCGKPRASLDRSRTLTAHALAQRLLDALRGGVGMSEARGDPSTLGCAWISGYSFPTPLLVQDRRQSTGSGERKEATAWNLPGQTGPVSLKYISKDIDSQPREFEEHRYFCSLGIAVPTERFQIVLTCHVREAESKLFFLMFNDTLRRVGNYWSVRHWIGGAGTFGWISGFEDPTCHWSRNTAGPPQVPGQESNS